jgi:hypothetical protein
MIRRGLTAAAFIAIGVCATAMKAENDARRVKKSVERSTLDQAGTKPFHLKAELAPSLARDRDSGRTGEVEIWWVSPDRWRREITSPQFHQIDIVDGIKEWQKNDGDYFPEWLRETAVALVRPAPDLDDLIKRVNGADVKHLMGSTYYQWMTMGSDGTVQKGMGASFAITDSTDLEFYGGDVGWGGLYKDYKGFHNRTVGRTVAVGSPEVTAKIVVLEDLKNPPTNFFDTSAASDPLLKTVVLSEKDLRKNLTTRNAPLEWPPVASGPLEGVTICDVTVDRGGRVREVNMPVSDNPALNHAFLEKVAGLQFAPYKVDGNEVQVVSTITMPFKTNRAADSK